MENKIINQKNQLDILNGNLTKYNSPELYNEVNQAMIRYLKDGKDEAKKERIKRLLLKRQIEF